MEYLINQYLEELNIRKLSKNTIDAYKRDLIRFFAFIESKNIDCNSVDTNSVIEYIDELQGLGRTNSSISRNIVALRNFYKYLMKRGLIYDNPVAMYEMPREKRELPKIISYEQVEKLLSIPDLKTEKGIRDKAMLEIMYATGLKVTELVNLKKEDINLKYKYIKCIGAKNKERTIPIGSMAINSVENYLDIRSKYDSEKGDYLFLNHSGKQMSRQGFWKIIKAYAKIAEIDIDINTFTLRHSCAVHMLENGADVKLIQELFGLNAMTATQVYLSMSNKNKLLDTYKDTHPRA